MTTTYKQLGQSKPTAASLTACYTVPAATSVIVFTINVCNHAAAPDYFRISVAIAGAADTAAQYWYGGSTQSGLYLGPNDTFQVTTSIPLQATDVVRVYSLNGTSSFSLAGCEIT